jgi:hypothetical protein
MVMTIPMILVLIFYYYLTAVWTGTGATTGNHTVMDTSMKSPCLASTWVPSGLLNFYTVVGPL